MKLKLDENLGQRTLDLFQHRGHDVSTVAQEALSSAQDRELIETCRREGRCLVTLDLDFGNRLLFRPSDYSGIAVLRLPAKPCPDDLRDLAETLAAALERRTIQGKLWVVQKGRLREYQPDN